MYSGINARACANDFATNAVNLRKNKIALLSTKSEISNGESCSVVYYIEKRSRRNLATDFGETYANRRYHKKDERRKRRVVSPMKKVKDIDKTHFKFLPQTARSISSAKSAIRAIVMAVGLLSLIA